MAGNGVRNNKRIGTEADPYRIHLETLFMKWKPIVAGIAVLATTIVALGFFWPFGPRKATLRLPGVVEIQEVHLGSKIGGRVEDVFINEGDVVGAGEKLVSFEIPELRAQLRQWEARLQAARADFDKAWNGPRPEEIRQAESEAKAADADMQQASKEMERIRKLFNQGGSSQADVDVAQGNYDRFRNRLKLSQARLELLYAGTRQEEIRTAYAILVETRAKLDEIQTNINESVVRAPGLDNYRPNEDQRYAVDVLAVRKGDIVTPNQPIVRVLRAGDLWIKVYVPETQLGKVRVGQDVDVTIDSYPGELFKGQVIFIAAESEFTPRNIQSADERQHQVFGIKVRVPQPIDPAKRIFKSGMAAEVRLPLEEAR